MAGSRSAATALSSATILALLPFPPETALYSGLMRPRPTSSALRNSVCGKEAERQWRGVEGKA